MLHETLMVCKAAWPMHCSVWLRARRSQQRFRDRQQARITESEERLRQCRAALAQLQVSSLSLRRIWQHQCIGAKLSFIGRPQSRPPAFLSVRAYLAMPWRSLGGPNSQDVGFWAKP